MTHLSEGELRHVLMAHTELLKVGLTQGRNRDNPIYTPIKDIRETIARMLFLIDDNA